MWRRLSPRDYATLVRAAVVTLWIEVGLKVFSLPQLSRQLGVRFDVSPSTESTADPRPSLPLRVQRAAWATDRVMRAMRIDGTCLRGSLATGYLVRDLGVSLRLGALSDATGLSAHAWLVGDSWVFSTDDRVYQPLVTSQPDAAIR